MTPARPSVTEGAGRRRTDRTGRSAAGSLAVVVVLALLAPALAAPPPAAAQTSEPRVRLTVGELSGVLGPGSRPPPDTDTAEVERPPMDLDLRVLVENIGDDPIADLTLVLEVHPPVTSRGELRAALNGELSTAASSVRSVDVLEGGQLPAGELTGVSETIDRDAVSWPDGGAVRPVRVAVTRGLQVLDEVVLPAVWLAEVPDDPLATTLVWPLDGPPLRTVGGAYHGGADRELRPGGRLDTLLRAIERADDPPVAFAPAPHLLEDLADRADGFTSFERQEGGALESRAVTAASEEARLADEVLQRIREVAADLPLSPLAGTYAGADLAALHEVGGAATELAADAALDGRRRLQRQLGRDVQATAHLLYGTLDPAVLDLVPGEAVLVSYGATTDAPLDDDPDVGTPVRTLRTPAGRLVTTVVADPYLEESLAAADHPAGPIAATQRVLGETALAYLEADTEGSLLLLPPAGWDPPPQVAAHLLRSLEEATWLELTSPDGLVGDAEGAPVTFADPPLGGFSSGFASALEEASTSLAAAAGALPDGVTRLGDRSFAELRDTLVRASSQWLRGTNEAEAEALVRDVQRAADETFGDVQVATGPITLTSDQGQIPITLQRSRGEAITVAVEVVSQGRLHWPEGRRSEPLLLEPGSSQTVSFETHALSTGTFPVTVRVTDPSGTHELGRSGMTVRSTAISGTALSIVGLIILFLLLLGALRRPADRKRRLEVVE